MSSVDPNATADTLDLSGFDSPDALKGYDYPKAGRYHFVVSSVDETREKANGIRVELQVLAGDHVTEAGKTFFEKLQDPSPDHKDGGTFCRKRLAAFALATGLITPAQLGQGNVQIVWQQAVSRQLVAEVRNYKRTYNDRQTGEEKIAEGTEIDGLKMYMVNAQEVADVPKNTEFAATVGQAVPPTQPAATGQPAVTTQPTPAPQATPLAAIPTAAPPQQQQPAGTGGKWDNF